MSTTTHDTNLVATRTAKTQLAQVWKREIAPETSRTVMATINTLGEARSGLICRVRESLCWAGPRFPATQPGFIEHADGSVTRIVDGVVVN